MKSVQIPYDLFVTLVEYHLTYDDDYAEEIIKRWSKSRTRWCGMNCMKNIRLRPPPKNGSRPDRNT